MGTGGGVTKDAVLWIMERKDDGMHNVIVSFRRVSVVYAGQNNVGILGSNLAFLASRIFSAFLLLARYVPTNVAKRSIMRSV